MSMYHQRRLVFASHSICRANSSRKLVQSVDGDHDECHDSQSYNISLMQSEGISFIYIVWLICASSIQGKTCLAYMNFSLYLNALSWSNMLSSYKFCGQLYCKSILFSYACQVDWRQESAVHAYYVCGGKYQKVMGLLPSLVWLLYWVLATWCVWCKFCLVYFTYTIIHDLLQTRKSVSLD